MNKKKWLLCIIIVIALIAIGILLLFNNNTRFNKLVVNESKWSSITNNRNESDDITLENLQFDDYNLIIDNEDNIVYYSVVDGKNKYNPYVDYDGKLNLVINKEITEDSIDNNDDIKIMIYNKNSYRVYSLVVTNYPLINFTLDSNDEKKNSVEIEIFDNHKGNVQRMVKSNGRLLTDKGDEEFIFNLTKESVGRNKRKNTISILGMNKNNEFRLTKISETEEDKKYVQVFINNEHKGLYLIEEKGEIKKKDIEP